MGRLERDARRIFRAAVAAADPAAAVRRYLRREGDALVAGGRRYSLKRFDHVYVIGAGKAAGAMARAVEGALGGAVTGGLVNVKDGHGARTRRVEVNECGHPIPDERGVDGARRMAELARGAGERDLLVCVISGGASALAPLPAGPVTLDDKQRTTALLLNSGADIHEMNAVRKHLSEFKGGRLARLAFPATVIGLILSDVIGDDLDVIGSGPTVGDRSTFADAVGVLKRRAVWEECPEAVRERLERGARGEIEETPKPGDVMFERVRNVIVGGNRMAMDAAAGKARELGYRTLILSTVIEGEAREAARFHAAVAKEIVASGHPVRPAACVLSGGETTVTVRGKGLGGRNQEFALAAAMEIEGMEDVAIFSAGTDGTDGPTDAAGAVADGGTMARARALGMEAREYLEANDSYRFFEGLGDLVKTGPTGTNVMDVRMVMAGGKRRG